jgi:uncharacterized membrane protein YfcA
MSATNIMLSALLVVMLFILSPNLRQLAAGGICLWIWVACILVGGFAGEFVGSRMAKRMPGFESGDFLSALASAYVVVVFVSVLTFLFVYCVFAFRFFSSVERSQKVELAKPSAKLGAFLAVVCPFVIDYVISAFRLHR